MLTIPAIFPRRFPLNFIIVGVNAKGATCVTAPNRNTKKLPFELAIITVPTNCAPPKSKDIIGYIINIVESKSFHFPYHFSVFGNMLAAKANGDRNTKTIIIACLPANITNATNAE